MEKISEIKIEGLVFKGSGELFNELMDGTRRDLKMSVEQFKELLKSEKGQKIYEIYDQVLADFITSKLSKKNFREQLAISRRNELAIIRKNQEILKAYFDYVHAVHILYGNLISAAFKKRKRSEIDIRDLVNISIYGNLCRKADEIGLLLRNGFPDAALVLWRTFYEHGVIACFLMKHDSKKLALQFSDAGNRDVFKKAMSHEQRASDLKFPPLDKKVLDEIRNEYDALKSKYPKEFFNNEYGWAFGFVEGKINFRNLEEIADFGRYRPFYIWASEKSHPNFHGVTDYRNIRQIVVPQKIVAQDINKRSMIDPAQLTLSVLDQVNRYFIEKYSVEYEVETDFVIFRKLYEKFSATL